jgi:hypothetical protein
MHIIWTLTTGVMLITMNHRSSSFQELPYPIFRLNTDEPFELLLPDAPVPVEFARFEILEVIGVCGKYPSIPINVLGGVLALEVFITASGL